MAGPIFAPEVDPRNNLLPDRPLVLPTTLNFSPTPIIIDLSHDKDIQPPVKPPHEVDAELNQAVEGAPVTKNWVGTRTRSSLINPPPKEDLEKLSAIEILGDQFMKGFLTTRQGRYGTAARQEGLEELPERVIEIQKVIRGFGEPDVDGFLSYAAAAAEVVGQMTASFGQVELLNRMAAGGAVGGLLGVSGGPAAGITVPAGAAVGVAAGAIQHFAIETFNIEGGLAYIDLIQDGVPQQEAAYLSLAVGVANSALEITGAKFVLTPIIKYGKKAFKKGIIEGLKSEKVRDIAKNFSLAYGGAISGEVITEISQEWVNIVAEEIGKEFTGKDNITQEEFIERTAQIAEKTFKAMVLLAVPGGAVNIVVDTKEVMEAKRNKETLDKIVEIMKTVDLEQEVVAEHFSEVLTDLGFSKVNIPADKLAEWIDNTGDTTMISRLGVEGQMDEAIVTGGDVVVNADKFAKEIALNDNYDALAPHVRMGEDSLTEFESQAIEEEMFSEEAEVTEPVDTTIVEKAEAAMGLDGLFKTGNEAGLTEKKYTEYLASIEKARNEAERAQQDRVLKQKQRELTKEWKDQENSIRPGIEESVNQRPVYAAVNNIQQDRLDRAQVEAIAKENGIDLNSIPTQSKGRRIYTKKGEQGLSVDAYAHLYDYESGVDMILDMVTSESFSTVVEKQVKQAMAEQNGTLSDKRSQVLAARKALHEAGYDSVLISELNILRSMRKQKRISINILKRLARQLLANKQIVQLLPHSFMAAERKNGRLAGQALRKGDIALAEDHKFKQLMNYYMAVFSTQQKEQIKTKVKTLKKLAKFKKKGENVPVIYQKAITEALSAISLLPRLSNRKRADLLAIMSKPDRPNIPKRLLEDKRLNYRTMTIAEFNTLYETVRDIRKKGLDANKTKLKGEKVTVDLIGELIADTMLENLPRHPKKGEGTRWQEMKKTASRAAVLLMFNADTVLSEMDGFKDLGISYSNIKGRHDRAMSVGYNPNQIGYLNRAQKVAFVVSDLFSIFSKQDRLNFNKKFVVPGITRKMTKNEFLSVLLNSGNQGNIDALIGSNQFNQRDIEAIREHATKKELDFAQSVWDYMDTFWVEVKEAENHRRNYDARKVEALSFNTKHGTYKGGYYPIRFDKEQPIIVSEKTFDDFFENAMFGSYVTEHTQRGHTIAREDSNGKEILLDIFVINSHLDRVIYDLEVGDAISDIWKILKNKNVRSAFSKTGNAHRLEYLELWLGDVVSTHVNKDEMIENGLRHIRHGITIVSLGWNFAVAAVQGLGLTQAAVVLGYENMGWATRQMISNPKALMELAASQSGFMKTRSTSYNKDINEAQSTMRTNLLDRVTPGNTAEIYRLSLFIMIRQMQLMVDNITWAASKKKGLEKFGNEEQAILWADRQVARSQGSGLFSERTSVERGTVSKSTRQSELIRSFSLFMNYYMIKANIAITRTKQTNFKNLPQVIGLARDLLVVYTVEAMLALYITGRAPEDDEPLIVPAGAETLKTIANVPGFREVSTELQGFRGGGGVLGTLVESTGNLLKQTTQAEFDKELGYSLIKLLGILKQFPAGAINKFLRATEGIPFFTKVVAGSLLEEVIVTKESNVRPLDEQLKKQSKWWSIAHQTDNNEEDMRDFEKKVARAWDSGTLDMGIISTIKGTIEKGFHDSENNKTDGGVSLSVLQDTMVSIAIAESESFTNKVQDSKKPGDNLGPARGIMQVEPEWAVSMFTLKVNDKGLSLSSPFIGPDTRKVLQESMGVDPKWNDDRMKTFLSQVTKKEWETYLMDDVTNTIVATANFLSLATAKNIIKELS